MCPDCEARRKMARDALYRAKVGETMAHVANGVAEAVGLKPKTGVQELARRSRPPRPKTKNT